MADPTIDAVVVATPAATHYDLVRQALLNGKSVLVEKPLTRTVAESEELVALAEGRNLTLMVGHTFLYNEAVNTLKRYIQDGELGQVYYLYAQRLNLGRLRQDVNAMWNFAPHDVSIALYLIDESPIAVRASGLCYIQPGIDDVVFMQLKFPSGIAAHIHISWLDPLKVRQMTVVGDKKMVVYDDVSADAKIQVYDRGVVKVPTANSPRDFESFSAFQLLIRKGDVHIPAIKFTEPLYNECKHFVDCIRNGQSPLSDGHSGLMVVKVLAAAEKSLRNDEGWVQI
jgi:predicted dehydrogenase